MHSLKSFISFFLVACSFHLNAQPGYSILYKPSSFHQTYEGVRHEIPNEDYRFHLVVNDSFSFFYSIPYGRTKTKKWKQNPLPNIVKELHHSFFYKRHQKEVYNGVAFPDRRHPYLVRTQFEPWAVTIDSTPIQFLGLPCRKAYAVNIPGDTIFAILSLEHPLPYGPMNNHHFPFIPLDVYHPRYGSRLTAVTLETGQYNLLFPSHLPVVDTKGSRPPKSFRKK